MHSYLRNSHLESDSKTHAKAAELRFKRRSLGAALLVVLFGAIGPEFAFAQTYPIYPAPNYDAAHTASVSGTVTQSGAGGVAGLLVKLKRADGTIVSNALTDDNGDYTLTAKAVSDNYTVDIEFPTDGFSIFSQPPAFALAGSQTLTAKNFVLSRNPSTLTVCDVHTPTLTPWGLSSSVYLNLTKPTNSKPYTSVKLFTSATTEHPQLVVANSNPTEASKVSQLDVGAIVYHEAPNSSTSINSFKGFAKDNIGGSQNLVVPSNTTYTYYSISSGLTATKTITAGSGYNTDGTNFQIQIAADARISSTQNGGNTGFSVSTNANAGACLIYTYASDPLPVKLVSFNVSKAGSEPVLLNWKTTEEQDSEKFEIERSSNLASWVTIGSVDAENKGKKVSEYTFYDESTLGNTRYYRLKMIDLDGRFEYSSIRSLVQKASSELVVFPNPFSLTDAKLQFNTKAGEIQHVEIRSTSGKLSAEFVNPGDKGVYVGNIDKGLYIVRAKLSNGQVVSSRLLIN